MSISHDPNTSFQTTIQQIKSTYRGTIFEGIESVFEDHMDIAEIILEYNGFSLTEVFDPEAKPLTKLFENKSSLLIMRTHSHVSFADFLQLFMDVYTYIKESLYLEIHYVDDPWNELSDHLETEITQSETHKSIEYPSDIVEKKLRTLRNALSQIQFETEPEVGSFFIYTVPTESTQSEDTVTQEFICGKITAKQNVSTQLVPVTVYEYSILQYSTGAIGSNFMDDSVLRPTHSDQLTLYTENPIIEM